jgi:uncharacterized protein (TIGR00251 family)
MVLKVHVQPGARKTGWAGSYGEELKMTVQAPAQEGAANQACLTFLTRWFRVRKTDVQLLKGGKSRSKTFLLKGLDQERCLALIPDQNRNRPD